MEMLREMLREDSDKTRGDSFFLSLHWVFPPKIVQTVAILKAPQKISSHLFLDLSLALPQFLAVLAFILH